MITEDIQKKIKPGAVVRVFSASGGEGTARFEGVVISRKHGSEPGAV